MRIQHVDYAVLDHKYSQEQTSLLGLAGYTDEARFILHLGVKAFLFGKHEGQTLVVEIFTSGFLFRCRLLGTGR